MELTIELIIIFMLLGAGVGFLAGLLGIGGGAYMVPILTFLLVARGIPNESAMHIALGTSMASIVFTTLSSMLAQQKRGGVIWSVVWQMTPGVVLGVLVSSFVASKTNSFYLAIIFTVFMSYVAYTMFRNKKPKPTRTLLPPKWLFASGGGIGIIAGLVSIAGGALTVPFLIWQNIDVKKAIGTSSAVGFFLTIAGAIGYMVNGSLSQNLYELNYAVGYVYLPAVFFVSIVSFFTAKLGVRLVYTLPVGIIKKIFGLLSIALSLRMLYSVL
ncbi:MAG: sulfite exporter TauE/SafE family protein [Campylobacteraceae bacterium]